MGFFENLPSLLEGRLEYLWLIALESERQSNAFNTLLALRVDQSNRLDRISENFTLEFECNFFSNPEEHLAVKVQHVHTGGIQTLLIKIEDLVAGQQLAD